MGDVVDNEQGAGEGQLAMVVEVSLQSRSRDVGWTAAHYVTFNSQKISSTELERWGALGGHPAAAKMAKAVQ